MWYKKIHPLTRKANHTKHNRKYAQGKMHNVDVNSRNYQLKREMNCHLTLKKFVTPNTD